MTFRFLDSARRLARALREGPLPDSDIPAYRTWLADHLPTRAQLRRQAAASSGLGWQPAIDLIVARRPGDEAAYAATQASLRAQTYSRLLVIDAPAGAAAINDAIARGRGQLVGLLEAGDQLAPHALFAVANSGVPDADLYYPDEDLLEGGRHVRPIFKPAWSAESLLSHDFVGGLKLLRRHLLDRKDALRDRDGAEEHDLLLRLLPELRKVHHLPDVLFHRRPDFVPASADARRRVIAEYLADAWGPSYGVSAAGIHFQADPPPRVAIIVPLRDKVELLRACLRSIERKPSRARHELIVVDNGSVEPATHALLDELAVGRARVLRYPQTFNWSAINNFAAARCDAEYLLFLNNDVEVLTEGWLDAMLAFASRPEIGAVGAQLLYPDGTLQHYGVVMGMTGYAGHLLAGCEPAAWTLCGPTDMIRNCTAVTGACLMVRSRLFEQLGGFDERFIVCGSDVEFCLRAMESGHRNVVTPHARLTHFESKTRTPDIPRSDFQRSFQAYERYLRRGDPYYNPQLSLKTPRVELRLQPEDMLTFAKGFI